VFLGCLYWVEVQDEFSKCDIVQVYLALLTPLPSTFLWTSQFEILSILPSGAGMATSCHGLCTPPSLSSYQWYTHVLVIGFYQEYVPTLLVQLDADIFVSGDFNVVMLPWVQESTVSCRASVIEYLNYKPCVTQKSHFSLFSPILQAWVWWVVEIWVLAYIYS
jgi:hypothetical protein